MIWEKILNKIVSKMLCVKSLVKRDDSYNILHFLATAVSGKQSIIALLWKQKIFICSEKLWTGDFCA